MLRPRVPRSIVRTHRTEHSALRLSLVEGSLPPDLRGHLFVVTPAGTFRPGAPSKRTTIMVGDGLISRFDLSPGAITVTARLARTHDFIADELTSTVHDLSHLRFGNAGLVRGGLLGTRNFSNTAFVPMSNGSGPTRMLLTYDAGRPVEIDPVTLAVQGPIGGRNEWRPEAFRDALFPIVLSPAHPVWDRASGQFYTVNYGRGLGSMAETVPTIHALDRLPGWVVGAIERIARTAGFGAAFRFFLQQLERVTTRLDRSREAIVDRFLPDIPDTFTDLMRWNGSGRLERFRLVLPDEREVRIEQSVHQLAVTRDHVIVLETAFKIGLASAFNDPPPRSPIVDRMIRAVLTRSQIASTIFYIVSKKDLDAPLAPGDDGVKRVKCRRVEIPLESDHFLADYDDAGGRITLHVAHSPATDLGEWVRPFDQSAYGDHPIDEELFGFLAVGAMDVGRFGRYVVEAKTGRVLEDRTMLDDERSWAIALYSGRGLNAEDPIPARVDRLYWTAEGFFPELLTEFVFDLYDTYRHREVPLSAIRAMGTTGRPSSVLRVETSSLTIGDGYVLPPGVMAGSLQLVPKNGSWSQGSDDGYLIGTVYTPERTELWILDASDLARGPIARLAAPELVLGFSLHTAWLPHIAPPTSSYRIGAKAELAGHVHDARLRRELERGLYPRFE